MRKLAGVLVVAAALGFAPAAQAAEVGAAGALAASFEGRSLAQQREEAIQKAQHNAYRAAAAGGYTAARCHLTQYSARPLLPPYWEGHAVVACI
ncbi:hypothetical protein [Crossiella sp. CA198]|uniref:hypothetical protein n=1 Tax=Crossiella sp. CA198 TaxID=3455607 RepID=UPI003F8D799E